MNHLIILICYSLAMLPGCKARQSVSDTKISATDSYKTEDWYKTISNQRKNKTVLSGFDDLVSKLRVKTRDMELVTFGLDADRNEISLTSSFDQKAKSFDKIYSKLTANSRFAFSSRVQVVNLNLLRMENVIYDSKDGYRKRVDTALIDVSLKSSQSELATAMRSAVHQYNSFVARLIKLEDRDQSSKISNRRFASVMAAVMSVLMGAGAVLMFMLRNDPLGSKVLALAFAGILLVVSLYFVWGSYQAIVPSESQYREFVKKRDGLIRANDLIVEW